MPSIHRQTDRFKFKSHDSHPSMKVLSASTKQIGTNTSNLSRIVATTQSTDLLVQNFQPIHLSSSNQPHLPCNLFQNRIEYSSFNTGIREHNEITHFRETERDSNRPRRKHTIRYSELRQFLRACCS